MRRARNVHIIRCVMTILISRRDVSAAAQKNHTDNQKQSNQIWTESGKHMLVTCWAGASNPKNMCDSPSRKTPERKCEDPSPNPLSRRQEILETVVQKAKQKTRTWASWSMARASASFIFHPPEREVIGAACPSTVKPTSARVAATLSRETPLSSSTLHV